MEYRKEDMWNDGRYEYERIPRHRFPPRAVPPDGEYHRVVNIVPRRPDDEDCHPYEEYSDPDFRDYEEGAGYIHDRRSGIPYRGDDPGYRWARGESHMSRHPEYRETTEGFRRKPFYHPTPYMRERSPHRRDSPFLRESPVTRKDSPHSRSGSSVSSRSYSPERGKSYPPQHNRSKERSSTHALKSSKDASPSSSSAIPPAKGTELDKVNILTDGAFVDATCKWVAEKMDKMADSNLPEATEEYAGSSSVLYGDQSADLEANASGNSELFEMTSHNSRSKAIAAKTKEIEEVYRQDCETFGMVVKMLIDKDPSLEKQIQFALRQNLSEIGERCIEELKLYIADYDAAHQDLV
ncbi:periphilin-1 [Rhinophrynus dorsalis]